MQNFFLTGLLLLMPECFPVIDAKHAPEILGVLLLLTHRLSVPMQIYPFTMSGQVLKVLRISK